MRLHSGHVVPVVTTGLHCGATVKCVGHRTWMVVPVVTTGLHCGVDTPRLAGAVGSSSPSSRRGSIAAGSTRTYCA